MDFYVLRGASAIPQTCQKAVLAIGNFDGIHLGHRMVLDVAAKQAQHSDTPWGVLTFQPHPRSVFMPDNRPVRLTSFAEKCRVLRALGATFVAVVRFNRAYAQTSAEDFMTHTLQQRLQVRAVVVGEDFHFGHRRLGNVALLRQHSKALGFTVHAVPPFVFGGEVVSSSRVRALYQTGNLEAANALLGRPWEVRLLFTEDHMLKLVARLYATPLADGMYWGEVDYAHQTWTQPLIIRGNQVMIPAIGQRPECAGVRVTVRFTAPMQTAAGAVS